MSYPCQHNTGQAAFQRERKRPECTGTRAHVERAGEEDLGERAAQVGMCPKQQQQSSARPSDGEDKESGTSEHTSQKPERAGSHLGGAEIQPFLPELPLTLRLLPKDDASCPPISLPRPCLTQPGREARRA